MGDEGFTATMVFIGVLIGTLLGLGAGYLNELDRRTEAVQRGFAQYCPTTGDWAWIGECEEGGE